MGEFSPLHWLVVIVALLLLFGPKKIPELGRGLGEAIRGFRNSMNEIDTPVEKAEAKVEKPTPTEV